MPQAVINMLLLLPLFWVSNYLSLNAIILVPIVRVPPENPEEEKV